MATPFGAVDDEARIICERRLTLSEVVRIPFREIAQIVKGGPKHWQQAVNPIVRSRLAQLEKFAHEGLQRIGLEVDQQEQEFLLGRMQGSFAAPASQPLTGLT